MGRIQGLTEKYLTGDALLKDGPGFVFNAVLAWSGANAGDYVVFRDGEDGASPPVFTMVCDAAQGTIPVEFFNGKEFENGIFVDIQLSGSSSVHLAVTYK